MKKGYSQLQLYNNCRRKYYWREVRGLQPRWDGVPKPVGAAIHEGLAAIYEGESKALAIDRALAEYEQRLPSPERQLALDVDEQLKIEAGREIVKTCVSKYLWGPADFDSIDAVEQELSTPVYDMNNVTYEYRGRIDLVVRANGDLWVHDTKTTGDQNVALLAKTHKLRHQYTGYYLLARAAGKNVVGVMMDFIKKPRTYKRKDNTYTISGEGFLREPHHIHPEQIVEFRSWFFRTTQDLRDSETLSDRAVAWPQNTDTCKAWNRVCPYYDLCRFPSRENELVLLYDIAAPEEAPDEES